MIDFLTRFAELPARGFMAAIFVLSGFGKISAFAATQAYMEAFGIPGVLLLPTILFEIGAGAALLLGFQTRVAALLLAGFSVVSALIFHANFSDQLQQIMFFKNVAMAGGLLLFAKVGSHDLSVDQFLAVRKRA
ncbi:Inner membrane protein YqjF [Roseibium album]|nr:Inner membrane protein YqjF [Roseibium album]